MTHSKANSSTDAKDREDTLKVGSYARESIPARSEKRNFTKDEREKINEFGLKYGCHTCGAKESGTKGGNFVPDHQLPNGLNKLQFIDEEKKLNPPQKLFPHCINCSRRQAGQVTQKLKNLKK